MRLQDRTALVTGAASGLGEGIARRFAEEGAFVLVADIDRTAGTAVADSLGGRARFVHLDVTQEADWAAAMQDAGRLDVLVNNAGVVRPGTIEEATAERFRTEMDVDVLGVVLGCRYAIEAMKGEGGSIVNVSSSVSLRPDPELVIYSAAKAAVSGLTRAVALHCATRGYNIRCNAILPGLVHTAMLDHALAAAPDPEQAYARWASRIPVGRLGTVDEIASLATHLATDESAFTTGALIPVDGGSAI